MILRLLAGREPWFPQVLLLLVTDYCVTFLWFCCSAPFPEVWLQSRFLHCNFGTMSAGQLIWPCGAAQLVPLQICRRRLCQLDSCSTSWCRQWAALVSGLPRWFLLSCFPSISRLEALETCLEACLESLL